MRKMLEVLFEDKDIVVVIKPVGVESQSSKGLEQDMVSLLKNQLSQNYIGVVHRLDKPVDGIMIFTKNNDATRILSENFTKRIVKKTYTALVHGLPKSPKERLVEYLVKEEGANISIVTPKSTKGAKEAILTYHVIKGKYRNGKQYAKLEIDLETGRHHQIRVQLAHHGFPILGDKKYGIEDGEGRLALCATKIIFPHPRMRKQMLFTYQPAGDIWCIM